MVVTILLRVRYFVRALHGPYAVQALLVTLYGCQFKITYKFMHTRVSYRFV